MKYLKLMRVKHYIKNFLIFLPLIFSKNLFSSNLLLKTIFAFLSFSFISSVVYIINDIKDKEKDKLHEKKKNRPIASGQVSIKEALVLSFILFILSLLFNFLAIYKIINMNLFYLLLYLIINIMYSFGLKDVPFLDIAILVSGFLIRILYGASIIDVQVSSWLYLTIMSGAFYLGLGKRRNEIQKNGQNSRKVLNYYNENFLDKNMYMCLTMAIIFYSLWVVGESDSANNLLLWTIPLVILIFMKYNMDIESDSFGDPVEVVYGDKTILTLISLYAILIMIIIYV